MRTEKNMKRNLRINRFGLAMALCLTGTGCGSPGGILESSGNVPTVSMETSTLEIETLSPVPGVTLPSGKLQDVIPGLVPSGSDTVGEPVEPDQTGKKRIQYTKKISAAVYITSADQLPDYDELKKYDDAYFETHALVLVTETLSSGSIDVSITAIDYSGSDARVVLSHQGPGPGTVGTNDMAAWLLWAEVPAGLNCRWTVQNPALTPEGEAY